MSALATTPPASLSDSAAEVASRLRRGVVAVNTRRGGGSGTAWGKDLIVTNHHVLPEVDEVEVVTSDETVLTARVTARDARRDLAALHVRGDILQPLLAADSDTVRVGEIALAIGNPWGRRGALSAGIVVRRGGAIDAESPLGDAICADIQLAPGNSGGPMANSRGEVIGINAMIAGGMAVAVTSNAVVRFLDGLDEEKAFLGVTGQGVPIPISLGANDPTGMLLTDVAEGSPAERAGLMPGDILLGIEGGLGLAELSSQFLRLRPGKGITISLLRGGALQEVRAVPAPTT
jgi:serine protease Do